MHGNTQIAAGEITEKYQAWLEDYVMSFQFDINPNWCTKIEMHRMDGAALYLSLDNNPYEEH